MSTIYLVIHEDRHIDIEVYPHADRDTALGHARELVDESRRHPIEDFTSEEASEMAELSELTPAAIADGWIFTETYSFEGDAVRVVERELLP